MSRHRWKTGLGITLLAAALGLVIVACSGDASDGEAAGDALENLTAEAKACVECHATETPGIVADWDGASHALEAVSCVDCHEVPADSPLAIPDIKDHEDVGVAVASLVAPNVC